jgi:drug/metabolite transporter (DMT)-like permease
MKKYLPALAVISAAIVWSFDGILRQNLYTLPSFLIVTLEHLIGAIIFLPLLFKGWKEISDLHQRGWISVLWISVCGGILGTFFYTKSLSYVNYIDLSVVVLLQKFQPVFAIALAAIILKEKITTRFLILAIAAIVGGYFVTFGDLPLNDWSDKTIIAALLSLLAAFSWGSSTVLGKHALNRLSFETVTALRLTVTGAIMFFILISMGEAKTISQVSIENWKYILIIVLTTGSIALFIYYYGLNHLPASHVTLYELFWPLSAVMMDWYVYGRVMSIVQLFGATILLGSILLLSSKNKLESNQ